MTPIPCPLPGRILPPTTAYAAGLICECRPDLADKVREAVLGDNAVADLDVLSLICADRQDEQGAIACERLIEIVHYDGNDHKALHSLANAFGVLPFGTARFAEPNGDGMAWRRDSKHEPWSLIEWPRDELMFLPPPVPETLFGHVPLGDAYWQTHNTLRVCGIPEARFTDPEMAVRGSRVFSHYLKAGFSDMWMRGKSKGAREALRRLIPLHAHTVSPDPAVRAAWAKAHLDALEAL